MIVLGFATPERDDAALNSSEPTDGLAGRLNYYPERALVQLNRIKSFVRHNAEWEAGYLFPRGEKTRRDGYVCAEYAALHTGWTPPLGRAPFEVLRCRCNRAQAIRQKGGYEVSWIFDRLRFLAEVTPAIVYLYFADVRGMTYLGRTARFLRSGPSGRTEILCVVGNQSARSELLRGETIVHELVIHAWREAGGASSSPEHRNRLHCDRPFTRHSIADIEADVLSYVARGRPPGFVRQRSSRRCTTIWCGSSSIRPSGSPVIGLSTLPRPGASGTPTCRTK